MTFEELYNGYYAKVLRYLCSHTDNVQDAEDLANNAFFICYKKYDTYDCNKASRVTWLYVIVNNLLKNYYRDKKKALSLDDPDANITPAYNDEMERAAELLESRKLLAQALDTLDEEKKQIVILKYFHDKSSKEIAQIMGHSEGNVRVILNRSLKKLNEYFKSRNIDGGMLYG